MISGICLYNNNGFDFTVIKLLSFKVGILPVVG